MKAQFFIISSVIMVYVIILTFQYLTSFSDIRMTKIGEQQELYYLQKVKNVFTQNFNVSNYTNNGDLNRVSKDMNFTKNFFKQELLKNGISFDSKFVFFSNGFENGYIDTDKWTGKSGSPEVVNYTEYDGQYSLYSNGVEYVYKKLSGVNEVYARIYVNFKTLPLNPYIHYFIDFYDGGNQILGLGLWNDNNAYKLRAYSTSINKDWNSIISIHKNEWYYFELYWYENDTNSKIKAWYDGDLKIDQTDNSGGKGKSIDEYRFGAVDIGGGSTTPDLFVDCIAISNDYVGKECYPDGQPYFVFDLKTKEMETKTEFTFIPTLYSDNVLWLKFDEAQGTLAQDSSIYNNDGTFSTESFYDGTFGNGTIGTEPTRKFGTDCKYGSCLAFEGISGDADVVNTTDIPNSSITIMAWIYPKQISGDERAIVSKWGASTVPTDEWLFRISGSNLQFHINNITGDYEGPVTSTNAYIKIDEWAHVAVVYDRKNNQVSFYKNGTSAGGGSFTYNGQTRDGTEIVRIGAQGGYSYDPFNGTIDSVRIYNGTLSLAEIQAEMNSSLPFNRTTATWRFDETGNYVNDTHIWVNGSYGSPALSFDGKDDYVRVSNKDIFNMTGEMTVSAWIYPMENQTKSGSNQIVSKLNWGTVQGFFLREGYQSSHIPQFYVGNGTTATWQSATSSQKLDSNKWYYVTGTVKSNDKIRIYVNGTERGVNDFKGTINQTASDIFIGIETTGSSNSFNGTIDSVKIWNRVLSPTEILAEMNSG